MPSRCTHPVSRFLMTCFGNLIRYIDWLNLDFPPPHTHMGIPSPPTHGMLLTGQFSNFTPLSSLGPFDLLRSPLFGCKIHRGVVGSNPLFYSSWPSIKWPMGLFGCTWAYDTGGGGRVKSTRRTISNTNLVKKTKQCACSFFIMSFTLDFLQRKNFLFF